MVGQIGDVQLMVAYAGPLPPGAAGEWHRYCRSHWVLDVITRGRQRQRVGQGAPFERRNGVLALYAPGTVFWERQEPGVAREEAYMVFSAAREIEATLHAVCGQAGYCHIDDPSSVVIDLLRTLARRARVRRPGSALLVRGLMLETLGLIAASTESGPQRRSLRACDDGRQTFVERVADYLDAHLGDALRVADLAEAFGMSESAFAHAYRQAAGESPYHSILRSKMTAAKRMLLSEGLTVQQTAARLGFSNAFNFSRAFKRMEGCAPSYWGRRSGTRS